MKSFDILWANQYDDEIKFYLFYCVAKIIWLTNP